MKLNVEFTENVTKGKKVSHEEEGAEDRALGHSGGGVRVEMKRITVG